MGETLFQDNDFCFACGGLNPLGLHLSFSRKGDSLIASFVAPEHLQGFTGILHGGIIVTVLDDLMSNAVARIYGKLAVTASISAKFKNPARVGIRLVAQASVRQVRGRFFKCCAELREETGGMLLATAEAILISLR